MKTLEDIISQIESGDNLYAMRFEPHVFERMHQTNRYGAAVAVAKQQNRCTLETARVICATSWGRFQIMGFNLYDPALGEPFPFLNPIGAYLESIIWQSRHFKAFCDKKDILFTVEELIGDPAKVLKFARTYNGADEYAAKIQSQLIGVA
jgi:hypothetical protein